MRCSKCGSENPDRAKFCVECAAPFARRCPLCHAENPATAKFCSECAAALTPAASRSVSRAHHLERSALSVKTDLPTSSPEGERKTVTALFADIKGSMELMEDLDPEEARAIIDPALKLMIDAIRRYDGYVAQPTGDGVFALFGAPVALEDHPQRALCAALRMQEDFRRYSDRLRIGGKPPVQARVGVNTGEVVVRTIRTDESHTEYLPIGHSTGLASRMQALAPVGSIAATETTRKLCEGYFAFKSLGAATVKGVSEPVPVFEVTGFGPLRNRLQRAAGRGLTRFVGREREIELLQHGAEQARAGRGQIVAAVAEPGIGKSRLFYEFKAKNQSGWMVLEAYPVSHGKASAYLALIDLLSNYFKISDQDDERTRREKIAGKLAVLDTSLEETRPYIVTLLGIAEEDGPSDRHSEPSPDRPEGYLELRRNDRFSHMDAQIRRRRTLNAVKRIVLRESLNQPIILIVEDLHWIDDETQAFLDLLADSIATSRILVMVNYRPEYSSSWTNKTYYSQLRLDPLRGESAELLLSALLGDHASLAPLRRLIVKKTDGNPLFIEEIVQALFEDGSLVRNGTTRLTRALDVLTIPATVQGILAARIDRLPTAQKELLQTLAVIGKDFPLSLVRAVWGADAAASALPVDGEDRLMSMLDELQISEFICEQPTTGDVEYTFKHALTQEVAYKSVLQEQRRLLHGRIGSAIEIVYHDAIDDHLNELAHHYSRSSNGAKAIDYLGRAATRASQRALYSEAIAHVRRGLELADTMPDADARAREELRLQMVLGTSSMAARGFASDEVRATFARTCELARRLDDSFQLFFALTGLWGFYFTRGEAEAAHKIARESMLVARHLDDAAVLRYASYTTGASLALSGDLIEARERLESSFTLKDTPGLVREHTFLGPDSNVLCLTSLSDVLFGLGYPDQSLRRSYEALSVVKRESDPFSYAMAMMSVAQAHCARREAKKGGELSRELRKLSDEHGFPFWLGVANRCLSWVMVLQGRFEEGIASMKQQIAELGETGPEADLALYNLLPFMAEAYGAVGRFDEGFAALQRWLELYSNKPPPTLDKIVWRIRGMLLLEAGSTDEAERSLRKAIELSASQSAKIEQLRSTMVLTRLLQKQGRRDEARTLLGQIYGWFTEGFDTADLRDAKALLEQLGP